MRFRKLARLALGVSLAFLAEVASAQTGAGGLRGFVKDESGAVLPGVTVTATSPELIQPTVVTTDETGLYRLNNLPPGNYVIAAELSGFATTRRENILVRAGQTFTLDIQMGLSTLSETITVSGESPMIETTKPTTSITLDRDLIRAAPISSRRVFSDALDLAPGVSSRNVDDGVGRRSYYFKGAVIFSHVFTLEGAPAGSFLDSSAHSIGFGGDTIQDTELKLAGVDPASPTGTGVVMNIIAPRGGNQFRGTFMYDYQDIDWNADNTKGGSAPGGLPTIQSVNQFDASLGTCKAMTLLLYARQRGLPLEGIDVSVERDDSEEREGNYHLIIELSLKGPLDEAQRQQLLRVADKCPIHKLMTTTDIQVETRLAGASA